MKIKITVIVILESEFNEELTRGIAKMPKRKEKLNNPRLKELLN